MVEAVINVTQASREKIAAGVSALADIVAPTFGPIQLKRGLTPDLPPSLEDPEQGAAARILIDVSCNTVEVAGDGAAATVILARILVIEGSKQLAAGHDAAAIKRGIDAAVDTVTQALRSISKPLKDPLEIVPVATRASGADATIGSAIVQAMAKVGPYGTIVLGDSVAGETRLETLRGARLDRGYLSHFFITDAERLEAVLEEPFILVSDQPFTSADGLLTLMRKVQAVGGSLLILADAMDDEALGPVMLQKLAGEVKVCVAMAPGFGFPRTPESSAAGVVTVTVYPLAAPPSEAVARAFRTSLLPAVALLATEPARNEYPRLPVREGEQVVVRVAAGGDGPARLDPALTGALAGPAQHLRLAPTPRSRLR